MSMTVQSEKRAAGAAAPPVVPNPSGSSRQRFLDACLCRPVDRPPVWLMRQAGRALPEYRALKEKHTFLELVQTPDLAAEVTLQPIRRFGFDAAILFSDILVVAEGLGQPYRFRDQGGIEMEFLVSSSADIDRLEVERVNERLNYVAQALRLIRAELSGRTALIGFAGSPWTLANFMIEGGGVKEYTKAKALFYSDPKAFARLMDKLTRAVAAFLHMQIDAGAEAVQIFDSLGGVLSESNFEAASATWMRQIVGSLKGRVPVIVFAKGVHGNRSELVGTGAQVLGVDWNVRLAEAAAALPPTVGVQGNLDPFLLSTTPEVVAADTQRILREMAGRLGHIFNLGHGVPPSAKLDCIGALVETVRNSAPGVSGPDKIQL
jgi:uroporphyrinogen decarboxylase